MTRPAPTRAVASGRSPEAYRSGGEAASITDTRAIDSTSSDPRAIGVAAAHARNAERGRMRAHDHHPSSSAPAHGEAYAAAHTTSLATVCTSGMGAMLARSRRSRGASPPAIYSGRYTHAAEVTR